MKKRKVENELLQNAFMGLVIALVILYGINVFLTGKILSPIKEQLEQQRPANLHLALITADCENCYDMSSAMAFIKRQNVNVIQEKILTYEDKEAQEIIAEKGVRNLPVLVITGEVEQANVAHLWAALGVEPVENVVVYGDIPPYYSLDTKEVVGLVRVTKITDVSCAECYDVDGHMQILPNLGVYVDRELSYDVMSGNGKSLVEKYNITKVPTIILSADASAYQSIIDVWGSVGTVEKDGSYVFRSVEFMGTYKDLSENKIVSEG